MTPEQLQEAHKILHTFNHVGTILKGFGESVKSRFTIDFEYSGTLSVPKTYDVPMTSVELMDVLIDRQITLAEQLLKIGVEVQMPRRRVSNVDKH